MKNGKRNFGFSYRYLYKIWQILKCFSGTFHRAQTLKLGGVICIRHTMASQLFQGIQIANNFGEFSTHACPGMMPIRCQNPKFES